MMLIHGGGGSCGSGGGSAGSSGYFESIFGPYGGRARREFFSQFGGGDECGRALVLIT